MDKKPLVMPAYKAIMLDLDGTTIPNSRDGMPSIRVKEAIKKASEKLHVGIATSRCYPITRKIISELNLSGPSILTGGAKLMTFPEGKIFFQKSINKEDLKDIFNILKKFDKFYVCDNDKDIEYKESYTPKNVYQIFKTRVDSTNAKTIISLLSHISTIAVHSVPDWTTGKYSITINHAQATKQHGILEVARILKINTHEIIGVGDGYNDFPLLMACGLRIAMGNAVPELKEIADYVAPSVDDDGVADVIERYILNV